jgi:hypothetical protein
MGMRSTALVGCAGVLLLVISMVMPISRAQTSTVEVEIFEPEGEVIATASRQVDVDFIVRCNSEMRFGNWVLEAEVVTATLNATLDWRTQPLSSPSACGSPDHASVSFPSKLWLRSSNHTAGTKEEVSVTAEVFSTDAVSTFSAQASDGFVAVVGSWVTLEPMTDITRTLLGQAGHAKRLDPPIYANVTANGEFELRYTIAGRSSSYNLKAYSPILAQASGMVELPLTAQIGKDCVSSPTTFRLAVEAAPISMNSQATPAQREALLTLSCQSPDSGEMENISFSGQSKGPDLPWYAAALGFLAIAVFVAIAFRQTTR